MIESKVGDLSVCVVGKYLSQVRMTHVDIEIIDKYRHSKQWRIRVSDEEINDNGFFQTLLRKLSDIGFDRIRHDLQ